MNEIRSFIAINLPDEIKVKLESFVGELSQGRPWVKWVEASGIHLTLKFLGNVAIEKVKEISRVVEQVSHKSDPLKLEVGGLGAFPSTLRPQVIWVGVGGELEKLVTLQEKIDDGLAGIGFAPEERAFTPHFTIGRVREGADLASRRELGNKLQSVRDQFFGSFTADGVTLMRSQLTPKGAIYSELAYFGLSACQG
jgi:2'-5' RNA ligase